MPPKSWSVSPAIHGKAFANVERDYREHKDVWEDASEALGNARLKLEKVFRDTFPKIDSDETLPPLAKSVAKANTFQRVFSEVAPKLDAVARGLAYARTTTLEEIKRSYIPRDAAEALAVAQALGRLTPEQRRK